MSKGQSFQGESDASSQRLYCPLPRMPCILVQSTRHFSIGEDNSNVNLEKLFCDSALRTIHQGLQADGVYVCLDVNCSDKLEENQGPLGAMFHGFSVLNCMTTSLAGGGMGLGTLGFHEPKVRELCAEAGFSSVRLVPIDNPFNNLYEIRP